MSIQYKYLFLIAFFIFLQGCVAVQSFPTVARSGDTITLAVGSPEEMTVDNTTIQYFSDFDPANPVDLTSNIRNIIKVYPDKKAVAWYGSTQIQTDSIAPGSGHGPWLSIVVLDLPSTPPLPIGLGHFEITTTANFTSGSKHVNDVEIEMEIIEGDGNPSSFDYMQYSSSSSPTSGDLSILEAPQHVAIIPPFQTSYGSYGAVEIKVNVPIDTSDSGVVDTGIRVIFDDSPDNLVSRRQATWSRSGNEFTINIISQNGLLYYWEARTYIVIEDEDYFFSSPPTLTSIRYFDINGDQVAGPTPSVNLVN